MFCCRRQRQLCDPRPGYSVREQLDVGIEAAGAAAENEVLQRAAQADVLLAAERVERAGAAGLVDVHIDGPLRDPKEPGLSVVRVGRQDCRPHGPERARGSAPVQPALVGRPAARLQNAGVEGAIVECAGAGDQDGHTAHGERFQGAAPGERPLGKGLKLRPVAAPVGRGAGRWGRHLVGQGFGHQLTLLRRRWPTGMRATLPPRTSLAGRRGSGQGRRSWRDRART